MAVRTEKERSLNSLGTLLPELGHFPLFHPAGATVADGFLHEAAAIDPEEELAAKLATAHALGVAKGSEDVRAAMAAEIAALSASHQIALEAGRRTWTEVESDRLAELIAETLSGLEVRIRQSLQQMMMPFIERVIPLAAMSDFEKVLDAALKEDFKEALVLSGPEDLVGELTTRLRSREIDVINEASLGPELKAKASGFVIVTRIKNWIDELKGIGL